MKEGKILKPRIYELCRKRKDTMNPRKTNEDLAGSTNLGLNTVVGFLRGEVANPGVYTVGPICRELSVSLDDYFGIETPSQTASEEARQAAAEVERLKEKIAGLEHDNAELRQTRRIHRIEIGILLGIVAFAVIALVIDVLNPDVGWIRRALENTQQIIQGVRHI